MIIQCGKDRRLVSNRFGWMIQRRGKKKGEDWWREERPAYPASLAHGLQMVYERTLEDKHEQLDVRDLPKALKDSYHLLLEYTEKARKAI